MKHALAVGISLVALGLLASQGAGTFMARVRVETSNELNLLRLEPGMARR